MCVCVCVCRHVWVCVVWAVFVCVVWCVCVYVCVVCCVCGRVCVVCVDMYVCVVCCVLVVTVWVLLAQWEGSWHHHYGGGDRHSSQVPAHYKYNNYCCSVCVHSVPWPVLPPPYTLYFDPSIHIVLWPLPVHYHDPSLTPSYHCTLSPPYMLYFDPFLYAVLWPLPTAGVVLHFDQPLIADYYIVDPQKWFDLCALVIAPDNVSSLVMCRGRMGGKWFTYWHMIVLMVRVKSLLTIGSEF